MDSVPSGVKNLPIHLLPLPTESPCNTSERQNKDKTKTTDRHEWVDESVVFIEVMESKEEEIT